MKKLDFSDCWNFLVIGVSVGLFMQHFYMLFHQLIFINMHVAATLSLNIKQNNPIIQLLAKNSGFVYDITLICFFISQFIIALFFVIKVIYLLHCLRLWKVDYCVHFDLWQAIFKYFQAIHKMQNERYNVDGWFYINCAKYYIYVGLCSFFGNLGYQKEFLIKSKIQSFN